MINGLVRGVLVVLVGVLLISLGESAMPFLVRLLGVLFFLPAAVSLVKLYRERNRTALFPMYMMSVINMGSLVFGVLLMLFPVAFLEFIVILLALALLCFSLFQLFLVISLYASQKKGLGLLAMPLLLLAVSVVVLFNPFKVISTATMVIGICLVVSGVSDIVISISSKRATSANLEKL